ncbi:choice-of-anchor Q domain-containing protein, partial [Luteimonas pelagia]
VGHCTYFRNRHFMQDGDLCRAYGATLRLVLTGNDTVVVRHNTLAGEGDAQIVHTGGTSSDRIMIQNNVGVGFPYFVDGTKRGFTGGSVSGEKTVSGNLAWNVVSCPTGVTCANPTLADMTLAGFDAEPLDGSPVIDKVAVMSSVPTDFLLQPRPAGASSDIGAYEVQDGSGTTPAPEPEPEPEPDPTPEPTPTCTRAAPTVTLQGDSSAAAPGATKAYAFKATNNDSAACSNTTFQVARSVPTGWTGTLSASSVTLAPGASGNLTLSVTSSTTAAGGSYGIGTAVGSAVGSLHTAQASATYTVSVPEADPVDLAASVGTDRTVYAPGDTVHFSARVMGDGVPVEGATVQFSSDLHKSMELQLTATTDRNGYARGSIDLKRGRWAEGRFRIEAAASEGASTTTATTAFEVR